MTQYLYGAKVQGIQSYIFETSRLQQIAGASELVEALCDATAETSFAQCVKEAQVTYDEENLLRNAAGEIAYLFPDRASCEQVVRNFEQFIVDKMPGLTVSQAVIKVEADKADQLGDLSRKLTRQLQIQRNMSSPPGAPAWMISERARRTGRPGVAWVEKDGLIDRAQETKRKAAQYQRLHNKMMGEGHGFGPNKDFAFDLEDITNGRERAWLAVVHADGNNLGKLIQTFLPKLAEKGIKVKEGYRQFSLKLEAATQAAAQQAYREVLLPVIEQEREAVDRKRAAGEKAAYPKLPFRPVIIGGDDLTVILRGEHAVPFTRAYLAAFEEETRGKFKKYAEDYGLEQYFQDGLTACAGIAIIKPKYPFHYAADLSESLCSWTKKIAKKINPDNPDNPDNLKRTPSALHFHKVQSSFVDDYKSIIERSLTLSDKKRLTGGPYFLNSSEKPKDAFLINELLDYTKLLQRKDAPAGPLRDYVGQLQVDTAAAEQQLQRIQQVNSEQINKQLRLDALFRGRKIDDETTKTTLLYDALQLLPR